LYEAYNDLTAMADYEGIFELMDTIEKIYINIPHYAESYEMGVLYNNRAATYISMAITTHYNDSVLSDSLLNLAQYHVERSIALYKGWLDEWDDRPINEIKDMLEPHFNSQISEFKEGDVKRFINKRAKEIKEAQLETPRRLSVSYTNLGIIYRHRELYDEAVNEYITALTIWPDNLAAENNLSILMGKPLKKRSIIRYFFPKDRINNN